MNAHDVLGEDLVAGLPTEYAIGIDIGSRQAKAALIGNGSIPTAITASGFDSKETANRLVSRLLKQEGITRKDVTCLVGTGYGRIAIAYEDLATGMATEISWRLGSTRSTARPGPSSTSAARTPRRSAGRPGCRIPHERQMRRRHRPLPGAHRRTAWIQPGGTWRTLAGSGKADLA